jgi:hypothetical protein
MAKCNLTQTNINAMNKKQNEIPGEKIISKYCGRCKQPPLRIRKV